MVIPPGSANPPESAAVCNLGITAARKYGGATAQAGRLILVSYAGIIQIRYNGTRYAISASGRFDVANPRRAPRQEGAV
ncbi:hypothetical protein GCM10027567_17720 [Spongiibacter taiwanensis]